MVWCNFGDRGPGAYVDAFPAHPGDGVVRDPGRELHQNAWSSLDHCPNRRRRRQLAAGGTSACLALFLLSSTLPSKPRVTPKIVWPIHQLQCGDAL